MLSLMVMLQRGWLLLVITLFLGCSSVFASKWEMYKVIDTIPIKKISKKRVFSEIEDWFKKERNTRLLRTNEDQLILEGKSFFVYYNHVQIEDVFLSPRANERTTGNIVYQIIVKVYDSIVVAECSNFTHEAYYSSYGSISFGTFTDYETVPPGRCMESKAWCNKVWVDLKALSKERADDQTSRMLPESMVRKKGRIFKVDKDNGIDTTPVKVENPKDYLNIENYLIQDETKKAVKSEDKSRKKKKKKDDDENEPVKSTATVSQESDVEMAEPTYESIKTGTPPPAPVVRPKPAPDESDGPLPGSDSSQTSKPVINVIKQD